MKSPIPNLRWIIAALIFFNTLINYVDRQTLSVLAPTLTRVLHLSEVQYGNIVQAFLITYTVMVIPAGIAFDRWGVKWVMAGATVWWSAAEILPMFVHTGMQLGFARFVLGMGEAFTFIGATAVAAQWCPAAERALLSGLANAAAVLGAIVAPPLVVWIALSWGWKTAFLATGLCGFLWVVFWLFWYDPPERHPRITSAEAALLKPDTVKGPSDESHSWWHLLALPQTWGLLLARVFSDPVWWFYLFWLPKYLTESRGFSMYQMGMVVSIPYLTSDIGAIGGGWVSGLLIRKGWSVLPARRAVMLLSVVAMPAGIVVAYTESSVVAISLVSLVLFCHMSWKTNLMTMTVDVFPKPIVASAAGLIGAGGGLGGTIFTGLAGHLLQRYSYGPVFWIMGFLHPISFMLVYWLVRREAGSRGNAAAPAGWKEAVL